jgi:hypothetical protein
MIRQQVQSKDLRSVGYNEDLKILEIEFNSGGVYQYSNVPPEIYSNLMTAPSKGKFFHANVKNNYPYRSVA